MSDLPSMWRVELLHPLVVHFPVALLMTGAAAWLAGHCVDADGRWGFLKPAGRLALGVGVVSAWIAVYTGDLANTEVARSLCDPTVVEEHEDLAYLTAALFSGAIGLDAAAALIPKLASWRRATSWVVGLVLVGATALLGYVGHLGSTLVYQQGAAVYDPSETCTEFE